MKRRVTYNKVIGIIFLVFSSFILYVSLLIGPSINTITGLLLLLVSILHLAGSAIVYDDEKMEVKNLFGITMKTYSFLTDSISIENNRIIVNGSKIQVQKWVLAKSDYNDLIQFILSKKLESKN